MLSVMKGFRFQAAAHVKLQMGWPSCPHLPISWQYFSLMEASKYPRT